MHSYSWPTQRTIPVCLLGRLERQPSGTCWLLYDMDLWRKRSESDQESQETLFCTGGEWTWSCRILSCLFHSRSGWWRSPKKTLLTSTRACRWSCRGGRRCTEEQGNYHKAAKEEEREEEREEIRGRGGRGEEVEMERRKHMSWEGEGEGNVKTTCALKLKRG